MKKTQKTIACLLAALLAAICLLPAFGAAEAANAPVLRKVAAYFDPDAVGWQVTFSEQTRAAAFSGDVPLPSDGLLTTNDLLRDTGAGAYFALFDETGALMGTYDGDALAGRTLALRGSGFSVYTVSAAGDDALGFGIKTLIPVAPANSFHITYHLSLDGLRDITRCYDPGAAPKTLSGVGLCNTAYRRLALAGWATEPNGVPVLDPGADFPAGQRDAELWAVWAPVLLGKEETFSFNNSDYYFVNEARGEKHYMRKEDYRRMQLNVLLSLGAAGQPAPVYAAVMAYDANQKWAGSCYGLALTAALQHAGVVDMLALQNVSSVYELEPDDQLISFINYYHVLQKTDWFIENKAHAEAPFLYKTVLRDMCDALRAGKPVLFSYYPGNMYVSEGHTVLLVGIYEDTAGNHVCVAYDSNEPWNYSDGNYQSVYTVSADYSGVTSRNADAIRDVSWTSDFDQYRSFDYAGRRDFVSWARVFFAHIRSVFSAFFRSLRTIF